MGYGVKFRKAARRRTSYISLKGLKNESTKYCNFSRFMVKRLRNFLAEAECITGGDRETNALIAIISRIYIS
jgi:hypothetical protein